MNRGVRVSERALKTTPILDINENYTELNGLLDIRQMLSQRK
jgi:hypothetical protein